MQSLKTEDLTQTDYFFYGPYFGNNTKNSIVVNYTLSNSSSWEFFDHSFEFLKWSRAILALVPQNPILDRSCGGFSQDTRNKICRGVVEQLTETHKTFLFKRFFEESVQKDGIDKEYIELNAQEHVGIIIPLTEETYNVFYKEPDLRRSVFPLFIPKPWRL